MKKCICDAAHRKGKICRYGFFRYGWKRSENNNKNKKDLWPFQMQNLKALINFDNEVLFKSWEKALIHQIEN